MLRIIFLIFVFCVFSWGACTSGTLQCCSASQAYCSQNPNNFHYVINKSNGCYVYLEANNGYGIGYMCRENGIVASWGSSNCIITGKPFGGSYIVCDTETEVDSVNCVNSGKYWVSGECKTSLCDSTAWDCHTTIETTQTTVASDEINCINGVCYGLTYCEYVTKNTTICDNECGTHTEQTNEFPMTYEGHCNDDNLTDDSMCSDTKCIESQGQYSLYQLCQSHSVINGEIQLLPRMVGGGMGSCKNAGYKPENGINSSSSSSGQDSLKIPLECYQFGQNCPEPDSSYSDPESRNPENGCICEPFDGQKYVSQIVCPDGSTSVIYSSCDEWQQPQLSSSSNPESSSATEWPTSSGSVTPNGDWTTYSQGEDIKNVLAVIAANTQKMGNNSVVVAQQENENYLNQFVYSDDVGDTILHVPDSMLSYDSIHVDTNGILNAIFNRLDSNNSILDTIPQVQGICPCVTFFSGNGSTSFANGHVTFKEIKIDMSDFHGFNLCTIISAIVVALASVVSFFIGFAIFKNVSQ